MCVCGMCETGAHEKGEWLLDPLELELQAVVSHSSRVPGTELKSSA